MDERAGGVRDLAAHPFVFVGGHVAVDFVNTVVVERGELIDRTAAPQELAAWVAASSIGPEYGEPVEIDPADNALAIDLRGALKAGFDALVAGDPVPPATLSTVNAVLRAAPGSELRPSAGGGLRHALRIELARDAGPVPWLLADAAADLMSSDRARLLRRCANHDTCVLLFLDTTRSHTRRWCSMELCGNRSKAAAHSARARRRRSASSS